MDQFCVPNYRAGQRLTAFLLIQLEMESGFVIAFHLLLSFTMILMLENLEYLYIHMSIIDKWVNKKLIEKLFEACVI